MWEFYVVTMLRSTIFSDRMDRPACAPSFVHLTIKEQISLINNVLIACLSSAMYAPNSNNANSRHNAFSDRKDILSSVDVL